MLEVDAIVHVFTASGRFASQEALQAYLLAGYTDDGDAVPSRFWMETGLSVYCPDIIKTAGAVHLRRSKLALLHFRND